MKQYAGMKQVYGAKDPQIRALIAQMQSAQQTKDGLEKEQQQKKESEAAQPAAPAEKKVRNKNAEAAIVNLQGQIEQTKTMINEAGGNIKLLQTEQDNTAKRIAAYEARIQASPLNEREWAALQRDHALAQQEYDDKMKKRQAADTAQNLEEHKAGETLEVLDRGERSATAHRAEAARMGGDRDGFRLAAGRRSGRRQGDEEHLPEEPEGCPGLHQSAGVEQHSAARKCAVGTPQAPAVLAGMVGRVYLRFHGMVLASVYYYYVGQK